jgi:nucleoside-diphosphate-sugar epimerase
MSNEESLIRELCAPSDALANDLAKLSGDVLILGAGGKMGPTLAALCENAAQKAFEQGACAKKKVYAVARFSDPEAEPFLRSNGVVPIKADLADSNALAQLPDADNIIFMAGTKFGTKGNEVNTWAVNARVPVLVAERFKGKRIVVFSSGNVYAQRPLSDCGASETEKPSPVGDYGASVLARERMFEHAAHAFGTKVAIMRLFYAIDLRYGVLCDIAASIMNDSPISLSVPAFQCIWQKDANESAIRLLNLADNPPLIMNVTGPETASVRHTAIALGDLLGKPPIFSGEPGTTALLGDAGLSFSTFGYPQVPLHSLIKRQAQWIKDGGRIIGKPTHFEEKGGNY